MPTHFLNLYQKPKVGTTFVKRYTAFNYRHKVAAVGGFDTAQCDLLVTRTEAERWLELYLGNRVAFYVDNPIEPIWEGLVNRVIFQIGAVTFTASLDKLYNRVQVQYNTATTVNTTTAANTTDSQNIYGIKQGVIDANLTYGANLPNALRDFNVTAYAWPRASASISGGANSPILLSVEFVGFYHTLEWEIRADATNALVNASVIISNCISNLANGTTFFDNSNTSLITTNTAFTPNRLQRNGQTAWQVMQSVVEAGDGVSVPWVMGITPTKYGTNTRLFYYQAANTAIEYHARLSDGLRVRNKSGGIIKPWRVQPDRSILLADALTGWASVGDDPREMYIEMIEYDAESQSVAWQTSDNIELEGAMQLNRYFKAHNQRFGAPVRQAE